MRKQGSFKKDCWDPVEKLSLESRFVHASWMINFHFLLSVCQVKMATWLASHVRVPLRVRANGSVQAAISTNIFNNLRNSRNLMTGPVSPALSMPNCEKPMTLKMF